MESLHGSRRGWLLVAAVALLLSCGERLRGPRGGSTGGIGATGTGGNGAGGGGATTPIETGGTAGAGPASDATAGHSGQDAAVSAPPGDGPIGGGSGALDAGGVRPRVLSLVLDGAPWYATQATQGIAADTSGKVYVADPTHVFMVDGSTVSTYLTATEAADPGASQAGFGDLDIGPDGQLYLVASWFSTGQGTRLGVMRSSQPHQADWWVDLAPTTTDVQKMAVIDDGVIGLVTRAGFWMFTPAGGTLVYNPGQLQSSSGCACEDLAAARSGEFLFQPGCNGSPILRGHSDGSGVGVLYNSALLQASTVPADNFLCVARDPAGGFYSAIDGSDGTGTSLYHVTDDAQGMAGLTFVETAPSFAEASVQKSNVFGSGSAHWPPLPTAPFTSRRTPSSGRSRRSDSNPAGVADS